MKWTVEENALLGDQGLVVDGRRNVALCFAKRDAALIAAAPEMYEALEHAYNWMTGYCENGKIEIPDWMKQARAAIAKAEGGNHEPV